MISFLHLRATGVQLEVENPKLEDYRNAERRACLHLSPQPPETKSDEMRDLVIWEVARNEMGRPFLSAVITCTAMNAETKAKKTRSYRYPLVLLRLSKNPATIFQDLWFQHPPSPR
jgi:hypothetical protein